MGLQGQVLDWSLPAGKIVETNRVAADEELVVALSVVNPAIVLVPATGAGKSQIIETPVRNSVRTIAYGLADSSTRYIPHSHRVVVGIARICDQGAAIGFRHNG